MTAPLHIVWFKRDLRVVDCPALSEAVLFTVFGAVAGARVAARPNAGLLGSVFEA